MSVAVDGDVLFQMPFFGMQAGKVVAAFADFGTIEPLGYG
jgi:hypothetical protein